MRILLPFRPRLSVASTRATRETFCRLIIGRRARRTPRLSVIAETVMVTIHHNGVHRSRPVDE